jgi:hypothetical protein
MSAEKEQGHTVNLKLAMPTGYGPPQVEVVQSAPATEGGGECGCGSKAGAGAGGICLCGSSVGGGRG